MRKIFLILLCVIMPNIALANKYLLPDENPFMGKYKNQMAFAIGQGFDTGILLPPPVRPVPFYIGTIQYSQPDTFFRIPARRSINISETLGTDRKGEWDWRKYTVPIIYLTEDIPLFKIYDFYMGVGAGAGLQAKENKRLGSKLLFQFEVVFGYNFNEKWGAEFFIQHFSNANTADENNSYAFYGLGVTYNF